MQDDERILVCHWTQASIEHPEEIDAFRHRYHNDEAVNQGVLKLIHNLHGKYKLGVLSNSPPGLVAWLADWKILHLFDFVFCSGDEGVVKPDPVAFKVTLDRLSVKPEEAVFIDDTIGHVNAAQSLRLHGILFTTAEKLSDQLQVLLEDR